MVAKTVGSLKDEKGVALVTSLLIVLVLSLLSVQLLVATLTETKVSSVQLFDTEALFIADAGLEEAIQRLNLQFPTYVTVNGATFNAAIKDTGFLDPCWTTRIYLCSYPPPQSEVNCEHTATIQPMDSWLRYSHATDRDVVLTVEHKLDGDGSVVMLDSRPVNVIGVCGRKGLAKRRVLAEVYPERWQPGVAVLCGKDIVINGNPEILGTMGTIHSNSNLRIKGNPYIEGDVTASGDITITGNPTIEGDTIPGAPEKWVPDVKAADYRYMAEYILTSSGAIYDAAGDTVSDSLGWTWTGQTWQVSGDTVSSGAFYVEGNVVVTGNVGTPDSYWETTIIAEGSIRITGNPYMTARSGGILLVAEGDADRDGLIDSEPVIQISGTPVTTDYEGAILSAGSIKFSGNPKVEGCMIAEGEADIPLPISGNVTITYNGAQYQWPYWKYQLCAWREL